MVKAGELITTLATQAGIPQDDANLKALQLSLATAEVPDEIANKITERQNSLLTVEAAKAHPEIKKAFFAQFADGIEAEQETVLSQFGIDKDTYKEITKSRLGAKRLEEILKKVTELESKKNATPPDDKEKHKKLSDEITALNQKVSDTVTQYEQKLADSKKSNDQILEKYKKSELFKSYKYTDSLPEKVQRITAESVFEEDVKKNNYKVIFNQESGEFSLTTDQDTPVFKNNKQVVFKEYLDGLLAENKLLQVTAPTQNGNGKKEPLLVMNGTPSKLDMSKMNAAFEESLQDVGLRS